MAGPTAPDGAPGPHEPELDDETVASRWAELTASLGPLDAAPDPPDLPRATPAEPQERPLGPRDYLADEDEDEGFVPPEPAPLSHADPALTLGWIATVGSLLTGLVLALVWRPLPDGVFAVLGGVLLAGVGLLLWRMPSRRDDDPSGGAVV
ncbi:MAG: hypothetical protein ACYC1Z_04640 [Georgenia sp.]